MNQILLPTRPAAAHTTELSAASIGGQDFLYTLPNHARPARLRPESVSLRYVSADGIHFDLVSIAVAARFVRKDGTVNPGRAPYEVGYFAPFRASSWVPEWLSSLAVRNARLRRPA
ncbi:hypothetical protein [Streptomyces californicus]|uniref:hypothetical protein n=1 Tax=Streptomyces californicus TaxID=67351 RepID=UPI00378B79FD